MATLTCSAEKFFRKAVATASHYGFENIDVVSKENGGERLPGSTQKRISSMKLKEVLDARQRRIDALSGELAGTMQRLIDKALVPAQRPVLVYHHNLHSALAGKVSPEHLSFGLQVLNTKDSMAEALLMRSALALLEELGQERLCVHVNSMGCRDSSAKFQRELTVFLRKHINELPQPAIQALKDDAYHALSVLKKKQHPLLSEMPRPMEFLTSASRKHLRELLEFMEAAGIPYEIDDLLVGHRDIYTQTVFDIRSHDKEEGSLGQSLARGGRYDELARRCTKVFLPAAGVVFSLKPEKAVTRKSVQFVFDGQRKKPRVFFIHVGLAARLQSLSVIEALRKAHVPLHQNLEYLGLTEELARAEALAVPYTVIMGHKEAMEHSVIVRNTQTRVQHTVPVATLPDFLKQIQKSR